MAAEISGHNGFCLRYSGFYLTVLTLCEHSVANVSTLGVQRLLFQLERLASAISTSVASGHRRDRGSSLELDRSATFQSRRLGPERVASLEMATIADSCSGRKPLDAERPARHPPARIEQN